jgi:hypothetical protein
MDAGYYENFWPAFFKSFCHHNRGWELHVADLGLTVEQRQFAERYGVVQPYVVDKQRRWAHLTARIESWYDLVRDGNVVLSLDTDMVVLCDFDPYIDEMLRDNYEVAGTAWRNDLNKSSRYVSAAKKLLGLPEDSSVFEQRQIHAGWLIMRGTLRMERAMEFLRDNWKQLNLFTSQEETAASAVLYAHKVRIRYLDLICCPQISPYNEPFLVPSGTPPAIRGNEPAKMLHWAHPKYYLFNTAYGNTREQFMAWRR